MASHRTLQVPPIEPKVFTSLKEIDAGITKLRYRIQDLEQLASQEIRYDDQEVRNVESNIQSTIQDVFGSNSPEFDEHKHHDIGDYIMNPENLNQQSFAKGILRSKAMLENLISRLKEKKSDFSQPEEKHSPTTEMPYVDLQRIDELRAISSSKFDLTKLIRLCEELNSSHNNGNLFAIAMLTRAIIDHVPPIFDFAKFSEVSSNYKGTKSFKESMNHLQNSLRSIADSHLHVQIRSKEILPTKTQVNFSADLDVLLAEIVRLLK